MRTWLQTFGSLTALAGLAGGHRLAAATVTLVPSEDTFISEHYLGNNGLGSEMVIGTQNVMSGFARDRGLLKFQAVSQIPANATITAVTLTLTLIKAPAGPNSNFNLHRML